MFSAKQFRLFLIKVWEPLLGGLLGLALVSIVLFYKLGSLVPGFSKTEIVHFSGLNSFRAIANNPLNAPYKLLHFGLNNLYHQSPYASRAISAAFGLVAVALFYYVVSRWHSRNIAILGTILFASSSWFLHITRLATPDILQTVLLATIAYGTWIRKTQRSTLVISLGVFLACLLAYIPGLIWFLVIGGIWQRKAVARHVKHAQIALLPAVIFGLALLSPLVIALIRQPELLKSFVGLPSHNLPTPYDIFRHIINVPFQIFFRGPNDPTIWLGRLPLLDLFSATMCVLGIYFYFYQRKLDRTKIIIGSLIIGDVLVGFRGQVASVILMPFIYILITAGIAFMLNQWFSVFPRNPLARTIGTGLIVLAVALSGYYNLRHYFVAWPNAPITKQSFNQQL